ncbi:MAG: pyridoxal phosphate-dependent aminotransferase [Candidatus Adiutrix sp.]|jgi:aspartate aminotransferase|nr:pyridoxal phosphate-dependent aminotransferase [Candidatus Adiutrix sp.]
MSLLSRKMGAALAGASLVRRMFEEGLRLKARFGADQVFDFSLGNPDLPPPAAFRETLARLARENTPHGYMPNAGWPRVREKVAEYLNAEQGAGLDRAFTPDQVVMTVGAAGGLNVVLKALLDPGDEVVTPRPYFMEYNFYVDNHGGTLVPAEPGPGFSLDPKTIAVKLNPATRAVLLNSPHNPTGVIYPAERLAALGRLLAEAGAHWGRPIFLIADEPYRKLTYDGLKAPSVFAAHPYSIVVHSHSKDLSIPGERIGYAAINPDLPGGGPELLGALALANRVLGFVNAPSLMQLALAELQGVSVDVGLYQRRRDLFVQGLRSLGYRLQEPAGAFYLFPESPLADDAAFVDILKEEKILAVPGRGFAGPGHFRLCFCAPEEVIERALPGFARALEKAGTL